MVAYELEVLREEAEQVFRHLSWSQSQSHRCQKNWIQKSWSQTNQREEDWAVKVGQEGPALDVKGFRRPHRAKDRGSQPVLL